MKISFENKVALVTGAEMRMTTLKRNCHLDQRIHGPAAHPR